MTILRLLLLALSVAWCAGAVTRSVGPGKPYAKPCEAFAAAVDGDVIEIDAAGAYDGDVCPITKNNLTIRGVGGRAKIDAAGKYAWGKGIWVVAGNNTVIENIEFSGATVPDRNGAGIRLDGGNLTVRNCFFHDNENGILGGFYGTVLIEHSEFLNNGYGDGYSHNIYLGGGITQFTMRYSASRSARAGHLVKSRAASNYILYNRLTEENGTGSYELDLSNAGLTYVIGNTIQQGETTQNRGMISYGMEGVSSTSPNLLHIVNNTFVSTRSAGATYVQIGAGVVTPAVIRNNIFSGSGILSTQASSQFSGNVTSGDMAFVNPTQYDFHITNLSAALNAGVEPGTGNGYSLRPVMQYFHPLCGEPRVDVGPIDAGAFEYGVVGGNPVCATPIVVPPPPPPPAPAPVLSALALSQLEVTGGAAVTGTVTLSAPAGTSGAVVALSSTAPAAASVPASITIAAGQTSATFSVTTAAVITSTNATINATLDGKTLSAALTVKPPIVPATPVKITAFTVSPVRVTPGSKFELRIQLCAPAPVGGLKVQLFSTTSFTLLPQTITVPAGATSVAAYGTIDKKATPRKVLLRARTAANEMLCLLIITK